MNLTETHQGEGREDLLFLFNSPQTQSTMQSVPLHSAECLVLFLTGSLMSGFFNQFFSALPSIELQKTVQICNSVEF